MKVLICFGSLFGLRGNDEHTNLMTNQITEGTYKPDHPLFPNFKYCGLKDFLDKTHHLSLNKPFVRKEIELGRFPVISDGISGNVAQDIGGTIGRLLSKIPVGKGSGRFYLRIRRDGNGFCDSPLGKTKIREMMRDAFQILGISNWKTLRPHALRGHFITTLANDKSVSVAETMAAARHTSVSASANYQSRNCHSESNRVQALLGTLVEDNDSRAEVTSIITDEMVISADEKQPETSVQGHDDVNESFSSLTQIEVDNLEAELTEMEIAPQPEIHDSVPRFCVGTNTIGAAQRGRYNQFNHRRSYPQSYRPIYQPQHSRQSHPTFSHSRRNFSQSQAPSQRVMEIRSIRRRLSVMRREDEMMGFPYGSQEQEENELYSDSQAFYNDQQNFW